MEEPATAQTEEENTRSLRAIDIGASTTLDIFVRTSWRKVMGIHLDWFTPYQGTSQDKWP
jgi:hypothetical protein